MNEEKLDRSGSQPGVSHEEYMLRLNHSGGHPISDSQPVQATINEHDDKPELEEYLKNLKPSQPVHGPFIHSGGEMNKPYYDKQSQPPLTEDESVIEYADRMRSEHNPSQPGGELLPGQFYTGEEDSGIKQVAWDIQPPLTEQGKGEGMTPEMHLKIEQAENKWLRQEFGRANAELAALKSLPQEPSGEDIDLYKKVVYRIDVGTLLVKAEYLFEFTSENHWISKAQRWCKGYQKNRLLFVDKENNYVEIGEDFRIAQEIGLYPVKVYRLIRTKESFLKSQTEHK